METPDFWIRKLNLIAHPEGGYFREIYRSPETVGNLPARYEGERCFSTSIYFLLKSGQVSAFHRIRSDETWNFYLGSPVRIVMLKEKTGLEMIHLGDNPGTGEVFQYTISQGTWFAARPSRGNSFSMVGCTVAPGFEFKDFMLGSFRELSAMFPDHTDLIREFCTR